MRFCTTRDNTVSCDFKSAILHPIPSDGAFYIPRDSRDLRRWIINIDENTSFSSIVGTLLSSFINDEYSPVICETIATRAFATFRPVIRQLASDLFIMELFHGPSATHRDFGISFLTSCFDTIFQLDGGKCTFLDTSSGSFGAALARALRTKNNQKAVIVYPKGSCKGLKNSDLAENGGNVIAIEVEGTLSDCYKIVNDILLDTTFCYANNVTTSNTANIGRLLMQSAFYTYAFAAIKNKVSGGIYYALDASNYSNVVAGLYAWSFALPLNGFILPATSFLEADPSGEPVVLDSIVPKSKRKVLDPSYPSCVERLENVFCANPLMMRHFLFPHAVSSADTTSAAINLYKTYKVYADLQTARAYAAYLKHKNDSPNDMYTTVLVAQDSPALSSQFVKQSVGVTPDSTANIAELTTPTKLSRKSLDVTSAKSEIRNIISAL